MATVHLCSLSAATPVPTLAEWAVSLTPDMQSNGLSVSIHLRRDELLFKFTTDGKKWVASRSEWAAQVAVEARNEHRLFNLRFF